MDEKIQRGDTGAISTSTGDDHSGDGEPSWPGLF